MSASSPPSVMLRAATATSGGTDAPELTYCSIWAWTDAIRASTSRPAGLLFGHQLDPRLEVRIDLDQVEQPDAALALHDGADGAVLQADDLGDLGQRADGVQLVDRVDLLGLGGALGDERHRLRGADGAVERLDAALAADLQRHDHLGEDDGVAQGHQRQHLDLLGIALFGVLRSSVARWRPGCRASLSRMRGAQARRRPPPPRSACLGSRRSWSAKCPFGRGYRPVPLRAPARLPRRNARHHLHRTGRRRGSCPAPRAAG